VKLLHGDVIAVHEKVQQVDSQVSGGGTKPKAVADDGYEVCKVSSQVELRGLTFVGRQLELLLDNTLWIRSQDHTSLIAKHRLKTDHLIFIFSSSKQKS